MWWWPEYLFKVAEMLESVAYQYVLCMCSLYVPMYFYLVYMAPIQEHSRTGAQHDPGVLRVAA